MCTRSNGSVQRMGLNGGIWGLASKIRHFGQLQTLIIILWTMPGHQNLSLSGLSVQSLPWCPKYHSTIVPIYRCLSFQSRHHRCQDVFITSFRHHPQAEEIVPEHEVLLVCSIDAAFCIWDVVLQVLVQCAVIVLPPSKPVHDQSYSLVTPLGDNPL